MARPNLTLLNALKQLPQVPTTQIGKVAPSKKPPITGKKKKKNIKFVKSRRNDERLKNIGTI